MTDQHFLAQLMHDLMQSVLKLTPEQIKHLRSGDYQLSLSVKKVSSRAKTKRTSLIQEQLPPTVSLGKISSLKPTRIPNAARLARNKSKDITKDAMQILFDQLDGLHNRKKASSILEGVLTTKVQLTAYAKFVGLTHAKNITKDKLVEKLVDFTLSKNQTNKTLRG